MSPLPPSAPLLPCWASWVHLKGGDVNADALIVKDGDTLLTGCGPAAAPALGFAFVEQLCGKEKAEEIRSGMMFGRMLEVKG